MVIHTCNRQNSEPSRIENMLNYLRSEDVIEDGVASGAIIGGLTSLINTSYNMILAKNMYGFLGEFGKQIIEMQYYLDHTIIAMPIVYGTIGGMAAWIIRNAIIPARRQKN